MSFDDVTAWIEAHPWEAAAIGGGGALVILWLLGFFSSSGASGQSSQDPLAAAYYAAEAQQAVVGGQLQQATIETAAQTAQLGIQANAAEAIAMTQANAETTINGQNASAATTIGDQQLLATESSNSSTLAGQIAGYKAQTDIATAGYNAAEMSTYINKIVAPEIAARGGKPFVVSGPLGSFNLNLGRTSPASAKRLGYTPAQYRKFTGL